MICSAGLQLVGLIMLATITSFSLLLLYFQQKKCESSEMSSDQSSDYTWTSSNHTELMMHVDDSFRAGNLSQQLESEIISYHKADVALCLMARNEHKFIVEWILYHKYIGVGKFYVYDNLSVPPLIGVIIEFVQSGLVEYRYVSNQWQLDEYGLNNISFSFNNVKQVNSPQRWAHTDCLKKHYQNHKFIGMIDIDEFIVLNEGKSGGYKPVQNPNLPNFLKPYNKTGGLWMYWRIFGSSGHVSAPDGGVLESYWECEPKPGSVPGQMDHKHLINTKYIGNAFCAIHGCFTSVLSVDVQFKPKNLTWAKGNPTWEGIVLNHYMVKSWEDYRKKVERGGGHSPKYKYQKWRGEKFYESINSGMKSNCSFMLSLAKQFMQERLQL
eukprot:TRINITY_DN8448_c0_g1_i1.p1 TRINITY_DN8448_c0_g1~~TRINITY_DN8448_c0_g1_i1.p1  ORF type:complete len:382 (+),score=15.28 TRINITY_DN8448_c0_g1_i1:109-1254(+)